jgi:DNA helicase-2/ATP-dependent DNA helicase PcrA
MIQVFRSGLSSYTIPVLIKAIVDRIDYAEYLRDQDDDTAEDKLSNVDELITKAVNYEETHDDPTLSEFLEEIALVADIDSLKEGDNRVLLMTLHSAKGLEFDNVYLAGMEDGLFPSYMTIVADDPAEIEEERRLAYVGITRARKDLTLTCARSRMIRGETQYNPPSRFVREIPQNLLDNTLPKSTRRSAEEFLESVSLGGKGDFDPRPKAILRPKVTAKADKPFIAQGIGSLNQLAGISKGIPASSVGELEYGVGDRVRHIKYGEGTVSNVVREPRDYKVTVIFDSVGQKIMYASFAKLKRI